MRSRGPTTLECRRDSPARDPVGRVLHASTGHGHAVTALRRARKAIGLTAAIELVATPKPGSVRPKTSVNWLPVLARPERLGASVSGGHPVATSGRYGA
jgi:hypothetical protein